jgi:hypothetical protein
LKLRVVDQAAVVLEGSLVLVDEGHLGIEQLFRNRVPRVQGVVSIQVDPRILEQGQIALILPLRLRELHLERSGIDLGQDVALVHHLALQVVHGHELPVDPGPHRDRGQRRDRSEGIEVHADVTLPGRGGSHGQRRRTARCLCLRLGGRVPLPDEERAAANHREDKNPAPPAAPLGAPAIGSGPPKALRSGDALSTLRHAHVPFCESRHHEDAALVAAL